MNEVHFRLETRLCMGNCVGHSIRKNENKIPSKTKNKELRFSIKEQQTNKEKLNLDIITVKANSKTGIQETERQNSSIFKDTGTVTESTEDVGILIPGL